MKTLSNTIWLRTIGVIALFVSLSFSQSAMADLAANARIENTVSVTFAENGSPITATVLVNVALIQSIPLVSAPSPASATIAASGSQIISYTLTSTANGPDSYGLAFDAATCAPETNCSVTFPGGAAGVTDGQEQTLSAASLTLGATTYFSGTVDATCQNASPGCAITVPNDGSSNSDINGIVDGETIRFGGQVCSVDVTTDNGGLPGATSVLDIYGCASLPTGVSTGSQIGEVGSFTITFDPDAEGAPAVTVNQTVTVKFKAGTAGTLTAQQTVDITVSAVTLTVTKYVKNISVSNCTGGVGPGADVGDGGSADAVNDFCASGFVTAKPTDVLEYLIIVSGGGGSATTETKVTEPFPTFVTYTGDSVQFSTDDTTYDATLTDSAADADRVDADAATLYVYLGAGFTTANGAVGGETGGAFPGADTVYIIYTVVVD